MKRKYLGYKPEGFSVDDHFYECQYSGHYKTCPKLLVKCDFHEQGCDGLIKREDLNEHHSKCARVHVRLTNEAIKSIREEQAWSFKEIIWRIPEDDIVLALDEPALRFVQESQRVKVGDYMAFLRLEIKEDIVYVKVCVDRPPFSPCIDNLEIEVENDNEDGESHSSACLSVEQEQQMTKDAFRTWSVGEALRYSSGGQVEERDATMYDLENWISNGFLVIRGSFRLKGPDSVMVECKR